MDTTPILVLWCIALPLILTCAIVLRRDYIKRLREEREARREQAL